MIQKMWSDRPVGAVLLFGFLVMATPAHAGSQGLCRSADDEAAMRTAALRRMLTSSESRWVATRNAYQLPAPPDTAISVVADSATCHAASRAHNAALPLEARVSNRPVYVVKVGSSRYVVWDRRASDGLADEYEIVVVFDAAWSPLEKFAT